MAERERDGDGEMGKGRPVTVCHGPVTPAGKQVRSCKALLWTHVACASESSQEGRDPGRSSTHAHGLRAAPRLPLRARPGHFQAGAEPPGRRKPGAGGTQTPGVTT